MLGFNRPPGAGRSFTVRNRLTGEELEPPFHVATERDVDEAVQLATTAFRPYRDLGGAKHAQFLRAIADGLEATREQVVPRAMAETALPEARINGELARTCGQLRMFATIAEEGSWADARIDLAQPDRKPIPAPDTRSMLRPLGPVAVFGASNFPLAFSTAGGDTASALAAGCPVVVKAHPAHPGTAELVAQVIVNAAHHTGMPDGVFSILFDDGIAVGQALVKHKGIKAVGFTGSRGGGLALWRLANERPEPIPVYAEMGSVNPTVVLSGMLNADFASRLHTSATMGVGQFCTNPGLVITVGDSTAFLSAYNELMKGSVAGTMLTDRIAQTYVEGVRRMAQAAGLTDVVAEPGTACVMEIDAARFLGEKMFQEEIFGPYSLIVSCADVPEAIKVIRSLEGQLTASIHGSDEDLQSAAAIADELEEKAGRVLINQFPTGVEVNSSMVHGGPFPATTDARTTSVGGRAITRWARPVCFQNFPPHLLPERLR